MHTQLAGLDVEVTQASRNPPSAAVILCHGFGAPGNDLVGLERELVRLQPSLADARFYFPAAPIDLGQLGWGEARAWWMIDMAVVQRLQHDADALREFRKLEPEGMAAARKALLALVREVADGTGLPLQRIVLGGFSQGSMLATDVALRLEEAPGALVVLSGTLLTEDVWRQKAAARAGLPVFQSHGRADPVLPFQAAEWLHELFTSAGLPTEYVPFNGGHTIDRDALAKLGEFLTRQVTR